MTIRDFSDIKPKREVLDALGDPENEAWLASYLGLYAKKLAEKQRAWLLFEGYGPENCPCGGCSWCLAQDYIGIIDREARS